MLQDLDFGEAELVKLSEQCSFPWLLSNMKHQDGTLIASAKETHTMVVNGSKIGFFGLGEDEW